MEPLRASKVQSQCSFFIKNPKIAALHHLDAGPQRLVFLFYPWRAFRRDGSAVAPQSRKYRGFGGTGLYVYMCWRDWACPGLNPSAPLLSRRRRGKLRLYRMVRRMRTLIFVTNVNARLVPEVTYASKDHGEAEAVGGFDYLLVAHRAPRLDDGGSASLCDFFDAVGN